MSTTSDPGTSVLVVEDDPLLRGALRMVLEWEGYRVACAADGREALNRLRGGERPSVILLDLAMPVLDGREFRQEQGRDPNLALIPVVVISGVETAASLDAAAHVQKPFAPGQLLAALQHVRRPESPTRGTCANEPLDDSALREQNGSAGPGLTPRKGATPHAGYQAQDSAEAVADQEQAAASPAAVQEALEGAVNRRDG